MLCCGICAVVFVLWYLCCGICAVVFALLCDIWCVYTGLAGLLMVILLWVLFTTCHLW